MEGRMYIVCCAAELAKAKAFKLVYALWAESCPVLSSCISSCAHCWSRVDWEMCDGVGDRHIITCEVQWMDALVHLHLAGHKRSFDLASLVLSYFRFPVFLFHKCACDGEQFGRISYSHYVWGEEGISTFQTDRLFIPSFTHPRDDPYRGSRRCNLSDQMRHGDRCGLGGGTRRKENLCV